jgi:radical SAM protein with 4Fe4S-binding SPASM domain
MIVLWRVTERCNYACGFCAYDRRIPGSRREVDIATVHRFGQTLGAYTRQTGEPVLLSWLGGEPMLWRPLFESSRWLRNEQGIEISATTNGSTLHLPNTMQCILELFSELTVSVDGWADFHEQIRGCAGAWQKLRASVIALAKRRDIAKAKLKLRINVVLMHDNLDQFEALCHELANWQVDEITFNQLGGRDRPEFFPAHRLRLQDVFKLRALLPALRDSLAIKGVNLCGAEAYLQRIEASAESRSLPIGDCSPGENVLFIDEAGRISPCSFTSKEYSVLVNEISDFRQLHDLPSRFRHARAAHAAKVCSDCPSTHVFAKFAM